MAIPWPVVPALAIELVLLLSLATPFWTRIPHAWLPAALIGTSFWSALAMPGAEHPWWMAAALSALPALWFVTVPRRRAWDTLLLISLAAVYVSPIFDNIYGSKWDIVGRAMWARTSIVAFLYIAREPGIGFGFWPRPEDWRIGAKYFGMLLPVVATLGIAIGALRLPAQPDVAQALLRGLGMFIGTLWFIALLEEFFFRGLLQRWYGLPVASVAFGLAHISFRFFPNWKHVLLAGCAGIFWGLAFREAKSVRAAMVSHALTNMTWVAVFGKL